MKRAWMLLPTVGIVIVGVFGCNTTQSTLTWPWSGQSAKPDTDTRLTSNPITTAPPASAPAENGADKPQTTDPNSTGVSQRIEEYLKQLSAEQQKQDALDSAAKPDPFSPSAARPQTRPADSSRTATTKPAPSKAIEGDIPKPKPPALASTTRPAPGFVGVNIPGATPRAAPIAAVAAAPPSPRVELIDVRPAARPNQSSASTGSPASANHPATAPAAGPLPADMAAMIGTLEDTVAKHPEQLDDQLKLRLLYLITGQDEKAVAPLRTGDPVQAEFITALLKTLRNSKNMISDPASKDPSSLAALDELRRLLGQQLPVSIPRIALVTRINSFGDYQALSPAKFPAGRPIQVFLYTEVYNFRSEPTDEGKLHTVLSQKVQIFDSTGKIVWERSEPNIVDRVVTPRRDFFIPFPINLPGELPAGEYILKVTVEDKLGATADQQKLTFTIGQ
jgi:hypothetical protein